METGELFIGRRYQFSLLSGLVFVTIAALILSVGATVWIAVIRPGMERERLWQRHCALCRAAHACLDRLAQRRPADVTRGEWEHVVGWTYNAKANCLECPEYIKDYPRFERFVGEFHERLAGEVNIETIDWIWDEIEAISSLPWGEHRPTVRIWIRALEHGGERHLPSKAEALKRLRHRTGQDFGDDVEKWRQWFENDTGSG